MKQQPSTPVETVQTGKQVLVRLALSVGIVIAIVLLFKMIAG